VLFSPDPGGLPQVRQDVWRAHEHPGVRTAVLGTRRGQQRQDSEGDGCRVLGSPDRRGTADQGSDRPVQQQAGNKAEQELFKQRARLADAERTLQAKTTKAASESKRIATSKIESTLRGLDDLRRTELKDRDSRIFPGNYAPVMVMEDGKRVIKPMRYHCRPAGKPAFYDKKYPGLYNARFDNLEGFWKGLFGYSHGLIVANASMKT
jgi:Uncharacterised ACR, COG2135.